MSQLAAGRTDRDQARDSTTSGGNGQREADDEFRAVAHDANTVSITPSKLDVLTSYVNSTQQNSSYVHDWLYQPTVYDSGRSTYSISPKTVIEVGTSSSDSVANGANGADARFHPHGSNDFSDSEKGGVPAWKIRSLRPRSLSRSREEVASPRSQRPRSPSPVRKPHVATVADEDTERTIAPVIVVHAFGEDVYQVKERPLRPRSASPQRTLSPPNTASQKDDTFTGNDDKSDGNGEFDDTWMPGSPLWEAEQDSGLTASPALSESEAAPRKQKGRSQVPPSPRKAVQQSLEQLSKSAAPSSLKSKVPGPGPGPATGSLARAAHSHDAESSAKRNRSNLEPAANCTLAQGAASSSPLFVPMPAAPDIIFTPTPMMPVVFNIARSLAGARPRRRFSEPPKPLTLHSRGTQVNVEDNHKDRSTLYKDSSTQTSDTEINTMKSPRASGQSMASFASSVSKGTQTSQHSSQTLYTSSSSSSFLLGRHKTSSSTASKGAESHSSTNSLRRSLVIAKSEPSPKEPAANAKSTKISRVLVNPEALDVMQVPHEAHDEHIIVHRILSREKIMELAELTLDIRDARWKGQEARERMWEQWRAERYNPEPQ